MARISNVWVIMSLTFAWTSLYLTLPEQPLQIMRTWTGLGHSRWLHRHNNTNNNNKTATLSHSPVVHFTVASSGSSEQDCFPVLNYPNVSAQRHRSTRPEEPLFFNWIPFLFPFQACLEEAEQHHWMEKKGGGDSCLPSSEYISYFTAASVVLH